VTVPRSGGRGRPSDGLRVHRSARLPADHVTTRDGIPVTTWARTLIDLAAASPRRVVERAVNEAERLRLFDLTTLRATMATCRGHPGVARLAAILDEHHGSETLTRSELEDMFLDLCARHELPRPLVNTRVGPYEVDFLWPRQRLIVETDGRESHLTSAAFERDHERDAALTVAGYRVLRFTHRQVLRKERTVANRVAAALAPERTFAPQPSLDSVM